MQNFSDVIASYLPRLLQGSKILYIKTEEYGFIAVTSAEIHENVFSITVLPLEVRHEEDSNI